MDRNKSIELSRSIKDGDSEIYSVRWNSDDTQLACAKGNGHITIYNSNLECLQDLDCKIDSNLPLCSIRWRPDKGLTKNVLIAASTEGAIMHWHTSSGKLIHTLLLEADNQALCLDYSPSSEFFAVGCKDLTIKIVDDTTKEISSVLRKHGDSLGHSNRVFSLKWGDPNTLFSAGWDNNILMWDIRTRVVSKFFHGPNILGDCIDVYEDKLLCADGSIHNQLKIWSISAGEIIYTTELSLFGKPFVGYTAQFSKINRAETFFLGGSGNYQGYFYQTSNYNPLNALTHLTRSVYTCDFGNSTNIFALGTADGNVNIFKVDT